MLLFLAIKGLFVYQHDIKNSELTKKAHLLNSPCKFVLHRCPTVLEGLLLPHHKTRLHIIKQNKPSRSNRISMLLFCGLIIL